MNNSLIWAGLALLIIAAVWFYLRSSSGRPIPAILRRGQPLPDFSAVDEQGDPVRSTQLHGSPAVLLFVRGSWCPFCSSQVENLTRHYKDIVDLGARLILVTPKPLETTRRVAEFFEVEFDFWLDESLQVARSLGLIDAAGVPGDYRKEYGADTVWPTAIVADAAGIITYVSLSKALADRPDPKDLLQAIKDQPR
jgi:peroxiredoxin